MNLDTFENLMHYIGYEKEKEASNIYYSTRDTSKRLMWCRPSVFFWDTNEMSWIKITDFHVVTLAD